jgi:uncharacterized membrane protein YebE (DUF533 family)
MDAPTAALAALTVALLAFLAYQAYAGGKDVEPRRTPAPQRRAAKSPQERQFELGVLKRVEATTREVARN